MSRRPVKHMSKAVACGITAFLAATAVCHYCGGESIEPFPTKTLAQPNSNGDLREVSIEPSPEGQGNTWANGFLSDAWRDLLAITSVVGVLLTALGLLWARASLKLAAQQLQQTRTANEAATTAAIEALQQSREQYDQHLLNQAHAHLQTIKSYIETDRWSMAAIRLNDLADVLTHLGIGHDRWAGFGERLRQMEETFGRIAAEEIQFSNSFRKKWRDLCRELCDAIAIGSAPFPLPGQESNNDK